jgi:hypothetical protein
MANTVLLYWGPLLLIDERSEYAKNGRSKLQEAVNWVVGKGLQALSIWYIVRVQDWAKHFSFSWLQAPANYTYSLWRMAVVFLALVGERLQESPTNNTRRIFCFKSIYLLKPLQKVLKITVCFSLRMFLLALVFPPGPSLIVSVRVLFRSPRVLIV